MTQAELDALPEMGGFDIEERVIDGVVRRVPVARPVAVLWAEDNEPNSVIDSNGVRWRLGWYDGVRWKQRSLR